MTKEEIKKNIGQLVMMGLAQTVISKEEEQVIRWVQPAGVTYFRRNIESPNQIIELNRSFQKLCNVRPLIAIDQEGGRVARLGPPFTVFPAAQVLGKHFERTGSDQMARLQATYMARELKRVGINLNFTPVADIHTNPKSPIIGDRSFSTDSKTVSHLVKTVIQTYRKEKVICCAKHFPGHGDADLDSHLALPTIPISRKTLLNREVVPFGAAIRARVPMVMTAHVVYPELDSVPATLSKKIIQGILRQRLGFKGVVVTDDLEMSAIAGSMDIGQAGVAAVHAGVDLLLVCKSLEVFLSVHSSLLRAIDSGELPLKRASEALIRVRGLKRRYLANAPHVRPLKTTFSGWPSHRLLAKKMNDF